MVQTSTKGHSAAEHENSSQSKEGDEREQPLLNRKNEEEDDKHFKQEHGVVYEAQLGSPKDTDMSEGETDYEAAKIGQGKDKVPDGGYGWFIVLGCFLAHVIIGGLERNDGVYFLQFTSKFGESAQLTSWPGAIVSSIRLFLGPVAGALCNRYSVRATVLVGTFLLTLANVLTAFTPDFFFLFFSHAALQGIARGLVYTPAIIIVNLYFNKKRGMALGLGSSGVGVGTFCLVPLTQYCFETYGFTGTFLLVAGICLNSAVVAMLFRPLSLHNKFTYDNRLQKQSTQDGNLMSPADESKYAAHEQLLQEKSDHHTSVKDDEEKVRESSVDALPAEKGKVAIVSPIVKPPQKSPSQKNGCLKSSIKILFPVENKKKVGEKKKLFNFGLLKDPSFLMFCCSICLFTAAFKAAFTFIPALVKSKGLTESEAAMVLSITGVFDTIGRITSGILLDHPVLQIFRPIFYNSFIFAIAVLSFILPSLSGMVVLSIMCSVYGFLTGAYIAQKSVVIVDILGMESIASSFGLLVFFQAIGMSIGPPLSGAIHDAFGRFDEAFYLGGTFMVLAGCLMIVSNIFLKLKTRRAREAKKPVE